MPGWEVHGIELSLDYFCDVIKNASLLEGEGDAVHGVLLHLRAHICVLDDSVLGSLLVNASVRLANLSVRLWHPGLCLVHTRISLGCCHIILTNNYN